VESGDHRLHQRHLAAGIRLHVDHQGASAACRDQGLVEAGNPFSLEGVAEPAPHVEGRQLLPRHITQVARVPGEAGQAAVVEQHHLAVGGEAHVDLHVVGAVGQRLFHGRQGVLRGGHGAAGGR